jgi:hypothetical protein
MTWCRTLDDILAAANADSTNDPPLTQVQADLLAAILAPGWAEPAPSHRTVNGDHDAHDG